MPNYLAGFTMLPRLMRPVLGLMISSITFMPLANAQSPENSVRGVIKAVDEAILTADLRAPVLKTLKRTGETFSKGDTLIEFDCAAERAEYAASRAAYDGAKARYDNQKEMQALEAAGAFDVMLAKAERDEVAARSRVIAARIKGCTLVAPYDGRVAQLSINAHEIPANDQPLMKIVGSEALELRLIVPSRWLSWIEIGTSFSFNVDETGERHTATISRLGAEVDAVSGTIAIIAAFSQVPQTVLPGMSGTAEFTLPQG